MSFSGLNLESYQIPLDEIKCATDNFSHERCIGGGGFGAVYKGQLRNRSVAVKRLGPDSYQGEREFRNEIEIISRFHHENIISFIGYCDEKKEMIIVYEYAINESLDHHLKDPNKISCITWTQRLKICIGAARGLDYLHSGLGEHNRVIHRDVKSANILLDDTLVAKICDFGLSKMSPKNQADTQVYTKVAGTDFYVDHAYKESQILRKESDVYSFGVVLFEILSGMLVYHKRCIGDEQWLLMNIVRRYRQDDPDKVIDPGIRDEINCGSFDTFKEIAYKCISYDTKDRPTLDTVIKKLEEALSVQMSEHLASTPAADHTMIGSLLRRLNAASRYDQWIASGEISRLTKTSPENRVAFAKAGVIPLLTSLLTTTDSRTQENTTNAILNLSINEDNKGSIMSSGVVAGIVHVLKEGSMVARENAAATLLSLSVIVENDVKIGSEGAVPPLVLLLSEGSERGKRMAVNTLFNLCIYQGNKIRAVRAGVVPMLMELLTGVLKDKAMAILALLSSHHEGRLAIGRAEAVPILVEFIGSRSRGNKDNGVEVLVELCLEDEKYLVETQEFGVMQVIMDLLEHGTDRGKRKARQLQEKIKSPRRERRLVRNPLLAMERVLPLIRSKPV